MMIRSDRWSMRACPAGFYICEKTNIKIFCRGKLVFTNFWWCKVPSLVTWFRDRSPTHGFVDLSGHQWLPSREVRSLGTTTTFIPSSAGGKGGISGFPIPRVLRTLQQNIVQALCCCCFFQIWKRCRGYHWNWFSKIVFNWLDFHLIKIIW